jgi:hypothetical protein
MLVKALGPLRSHTVNSRSIDYLLAALQTVDRIFCALPRQKKSCPEAALKVFTGRRQKEWTGATRVQKLDKKIMRQKP